MESSRSGRPGPGSRCRHGEEASRGAVRIASFADRIIRCTTAAPL
jgi:hypothetical protein